MDLDAYYRFDPEHDYEYSFVHHLLCRRGVDGVATAAQLQGALVILGIYTAGIGDVHDDEGELFWRVWDPALSGMLRAEAYLCHGMSRPTQEQWREIFGRLCGPEAIAYLDGIALPPIQSELVQ